MNKFVKYFAFVFGAVFIAWLGLIIAFKVIIDPEHIRVKVEQQIYVLTGYKAVIKRAQTGFFPVPSVMFYDVVVRNSKSQVSPRVMSATFAEIGIDLLSSLSANPTPSSLKIEGFSLDIQELANGKYNIHAPKNRSSKNGGAVAIFSLPKHIIIERGRINYTPFGTDATHKVRSINANIELASGMNVTGDFDANGHNYNLVADLKTGNSSLSLAKSENPKENITYNGEARLEGGKLLLNGAADFSLSDLNDWVHLLDLAGAKEKLYDVLQGFQLSGKVDVNYGGDKLQLKTSQAKLNQNALNVDYQAKMKDEWQFDLKMQLEKLTIKQEQKTFDSEALYQVLNKLLFAEINGELLINISELEYNDTKFDAVELDASLVGQEMVLNNSLLKMAGDTDILLFGIARKDSGDLVNIDGSMEILGKDFQAFAQAIHVKHKEFTDGNEGAFRGKSNVFISQDLNLFSNIKFQVGNLFLEGNVENRPKGPEHYNVALNAKGAKLDAFFAYVNPVANQEGIENGYDVPKFYIPWLDGLTSNYHLGIELQDFTMLGENGNSTKFTMDIGRDNIRFSEIDFNWKENKVTGDLSIKQSNQSPTIDCNLFVSELNVNDFIKGGLRRYPVERGNVISIWDDKPFDIGFMRGYDGNLNVNIGVINHDSFVMRDVALNALIEDGTWKISELSGAIWGGELNAKGEIDVSSIFSADIDFLFKGIMVEDLLQSSLNIRPMQGRTNIYGNINSGGISVSNLVDSLKGQVILSGRDISISGFDIAGMLQTLPSVRNINDVANTVRVALIRGKTSFSTMEGAFYFDRGVLKSHGIKLRSKHAIGTIKGQSNLVSWDMNYGLSFKLPTLSTMEVAEITLFFKESMDDPLVMVDSRDLESFMAKRKIGR